MSPESLPYGDKYGKMLVTAWPSDNLGPRVTNRGRLVTVRHGPGSWIQTWNKGGRWLTVTVWCRMWNADRKRLSSGVRIWLGPHFRDLVLLEFGFQLRLPGDLLARIHP